MSLRCVRESRRREISGVIKAVILCKLQIIAQDKNPDFLDSRQLLVIGQKSIRGSINYSSNLGSVTVLRWG